MIVVDIGNDRDIWMEVEEITVKLVAFIDEVFTSRDELTGWTPRKRRPNSITYWYVVLLMSPYSHAGCGGFAVRAGNGDEFEAFFGDNMGEKFVTLGRLDAEVTSDNQFWMVVGKCSSVDKPI